MPLLIRLHLAMILPACGGGGGDSSASSTPSTHRVSGQIAAASNVMVDSDVNDLNEDAVSNNSLYEAREISNPVTLGGFVNVAGTGDPDGRFYRSGDSDDFFRVALHAGDAVSLVIGEDGAEQDLYLYQENDPDPMDSSMGTGKTKSLAAPSDGTYTVQVKAVDGASNYTLSIGARGSETSGLDLRLSDNFVPGQVIVKYKEAESDEISEEGMTRRAGGLGFRFLGGGRKRPALLGFDGDDPRSGPVRALNIETASRAFPSMNPDLKRKLNTLRIIKALRKQANIEYAEPNYRVYTSEIPDDSHYPVQWNMNMIHLPEAREVSTGTGVVIAIVDTGVLMGHPDLLGQLTDDGYDFISDTSSSRDGNGLDDNPDDPGDLRYSTYSSFHGTHCAGIAAAASNNGLGVSGVAGSASIMPVRVLGKGGLGTNYDVLQGVRYAAGLSNDSKTLPDHPADIISLSLVSASYSASAQSTYDDVRAQGVVVVAASGNSGTSSPGYPAAYNGVISVSALDITGNLAYYSNYGSTIDVAAPGGDGSTDINYDGYPDGVMSTCGDDESGDIRFNYSTKSGTSMATPHVAGVVALMKALDTDMTPDDLDAYLENLAIVSDIGPSGRDDLYGYGLIDAYKAANVALTGVLNASLRIAPATFDFGQLAESVTLTAEKIGDPVVNVTVSNVSDNAAWLTVAPSAVDGEGLGTWLATVDRAGLPDGHYSASIRFSGMVGLQPVEKTVQVYLQMNATGIAPDSGYHYVLLVDAETLDAVQVDEVTAVNGIYSYAFQNVAHGGRYKIYAGTDRDFNDIINNYGESFGAYGSIDDPRDITVNNTMTGLDFVTELSVSLPAHESLSGGISIPMPDIEENQAP